LEAVVRRHVDGTAAIRTLRPARGRKPRRNLRPRIAAVKVWSRVEALLRDREFQRAYRTARRAWVSGEVVMSSGGRSD
jgi:hypothetical protein